MNDNTPPLSGPNFDPLLNDLLALDLRLLSETPLPPDVARATLASLHIVHGCYATIALLGDNARATIEKMLEDIEW